MSQTQPSRLSDEDVRAIMNSTDLPAMRLLATEVLAARRTIAAARAVDLNARGRSGGSVYMVNRDEFLALRSALKGELPQ